MQFWSLEYYHLWACHVLVSPGEKENGWLEMYTKAWQSQRKWECPIVFMNNSFQDQTFFTWPSQHFNWLLEFGANSKRQLKVVLLGARQIRSKFIVIFPFCLGQLGILHPSNGVASVSFNPLIIHNSAFSSSSTIIWSAAWGWWVGRAAPKRRKSEKLE